MILMNLTDLYYSNDNYSFQSKGVYGDCNKDENSYLDSKLVPYITAEIMN